MCNSEVRSCNSGTTGGLLGLLLLLLLLLLGLGDLLLEAPPLLDGLELLVASGLTQQVVCAAVLQLRLQALELSHLLLALGRGARLVARGRGAPGSGGLRRELRLERGLALTFLLEDLGHDVPHVLLPALRLQSRCFRRPSQRRVAVERRIQRGQPVRGHGGRAARHHRVDEAAHALHGEGAHELGVPPLGGGDHQERREVRVRYFKSGGYVVLAGRVEPAQAHAWVAAPAQGEAAQGGQVPLARRRGLRGPVPVQQGDRAKTPRG
mmetsp:Transcript_24945/g.67771  ORF Transcript_24945/g.67771 Transcript_24945/m.67771 type:complete len:266 (-) Transcript_24945:1843-2640(-)